MNKNIKLYVLCIVISLILFLIAVTFLNETAFIAPILIVFAVYIFIGAIIKLCKTNKKLKDTILCALDLLFWLP